MKSGFLDPYDDLDQVNNVCLAPGEYGISEQLRSGMVPEQRIGRGSPGTSCTYTADKQRQ